MGFKKIIVILVVVLCIVSLSETLSFAGTYHTKPGNCAGDGLDNIGYNNGNAKTTVSATGGSPDSTGGN